ncbi:MAG: HAMP domain-containing histidine kinase [Lachnospiraceae bacterium]|nr:HAMP domain-containing histidine kinase [Lachnospiraceae bacterium]
MSRIRKRKLNIKEEPKIILFTAVICTLLCLIMIPFVRNAVVSFVYSLEGQTYVRNYMREYLSRTQSIEDGTAEEPGSDAFESMQDIVNVYYSAFNDKSAFMDSGIGLPGAPLISFPLYKYGGAVWIADRSTGELVTRGDYVVLREGGKRMLCDIRACFSEEELTRICELYYDPVAKPAYLYDIDEFEDTVDTYIEKYVFRDGIVYPLVITFREPEGDVSFYSDLPFEYDSSEVTESGECILADDLLDPGDPAYQIAASLAGEYYRRFTSDLRQLPSDNIHDFTRGYITKITSEMTDRYIICQAEVINYKGLLNVATAAAWFIIILICTIIALVLCRKARRKREKAEYERSVTNALAHNYKSSLMVLRSCAENLICGVSGEKKTKYEQKIISETDRMNEATEKILSFYRTGDAGYKAVQETVDTSAVCRKLIEKYENISAERKLEWEINDADKFTIEGDAVLFSMAMDNVIGNAAKYALPGSAVVIRTSKAGITVENKWKPVDKFIRKPKLFFDAFVTGDDTPGRSNSGLGLSVAKDLLKRMKLKITAKADHEKVTFEIRNK